MTRAEAAKELLKVVRQQDKILLILEKLTEREWALRERLGDLPLPLKELERQKRVFTMSPSAPITWSGGSNAL